jgi:hypothetical protein
MRNIKITKEHIDKIIANSFKVLEAVYKEQFEPKSDIAGTPHLEHVGSRLIFPKYSETYRNAEIRLSEQELRFIFVEQFNKYCRENELHWYYSVETPTENRYLFKEQKKPKRDESGRSGEFDLTIHDEYFKRIALIEFKALNHAESCFTKDFLKLREEGKEILTYFIMYIKSYDSKTKDNLSAKIFNATDDDKINYKDPNTNLYCYALEPPKGELNKVEFNHNSNYSKK